VFRDSVFSLITTVVRLATGLVLFAYATSHLTNHAFGIRSVETFQAAALVLLKPWQTVPGRLILYTAFLVHGANIGDKTERGVNAAIRESTYVVGRGLVG